MPGMNVLEKKPVPGDVNLCSGSIRVLSNKQNNIRYLFNYLLVLNKYYFICVKS